MASVVTRDSGDLCRACTTRCFNATQKQQPDDEEDSDGQDRGSLITTQGVGNATEDKWAHN